MSAKRWRSIPSLPLQLFILTVLPLTVLLLAIAFGSLELHQRAMRSMVAERDERATRAASAAITEQLNHRQSAIRSVAQQAAGTTAAPDQALIAADYLLPDFEGGLALYTAAGELRAASNDPAVWQSRPVRQRLDALAAASAPDTATFLGTFRDPVLAEELMLVAATAGDTIAVGAFSPRSLARRALSDIFGGSDQVAATMIAADGTLLYQSGTSPRADEAPATRPGVADALRGESGTTYLTIAGEEYVIAFSPVPPVDWALVIEEPWRGMTDPLLRTTELAPLILIPALVVALVALWFGARQVVQPLQTLEQNATRLGWGDFAAIEEPVGGINEIRRLQTELVHMARKVQLAQQSLRGYLGAMTTGQEEERRRLARELHDDTIQSLIALNQQIQLAQMTAVDAQQAARLAVMQQMAEQTVADLRRLTRDLRPIYLEDLGLVPALEMLARDAGRAMDVVVTFELRGQRRRLPPDVELALYRIAQEGLNNVARHAQARTAVVRLQFDDAAVCLTVRDDGRGFDVPESPADMAPSGHFGLLGVQERAEAIGARLHIQSSPTGTELSVRLPQDPTPHGRT